MLRAYLEDPGRVERQGHAARIWAEAKFARTVVGAAIEPLLLAR